MTELDTVPADSRIDLDTAPPATRTAADDPEPASTIPAGAVVIGRLVGTREDGNALVDFPGNPSVEPVPARVAGALGEQHDGQEVALMFERGDPKKPLVIGPLIQNATHPPSEAPPQQDRETLSLTANREIVLRCGKSSITLTRAGKVLIRGAFLLSRSSGVNRIKGGSVQLN